MVIEWVRKGRQYARYVIGGSKVFNWLVGETKILVGCADLTEELLSRAGSSERLLGEMSLEESRPSSAGLAERLLGEALIGQSSIYGATSTIALCKE